MWFCRGHHSLTTRGGQNTVVVPSLPLTPHRGHGLSNMPCLQTRLPSHSQPIVLEHLTFTIFHPYPSLLSFSASFIFTTVLKPSLTVLILGDFQKKSISSIKKPPTWRFSELCSL